jgi:hypothetical protein
MSSIIRLVARLWTEVVHHVSYDQENLEQYCEIYWNGVFPLYR